MNGTGRTPGSKRPEINVRLPINFDLVRIRAGPGGQVESLCTAVLPHIACVTLENAECSELLSPRVCQKYFQARYDSELRMDRIKESESSIVQGCGGVTKALNFGANCYQAAVKAG